MVLDNKDEPYVLMWLLGNENNLGDWLRCNASKNPEAYAKLIGELTDMIHKLDPKHPVAVCDGDNFNTLKEYARYAQGLDAISYNSYKSEYGFAFLWKEVKRIFDRPVFISEFGIFAYNVNIGEEQDFQLKYIKGCWRDIVRNSAMYYDPVKRVSGNCIGGVVFDWLDRWYMDSKPFEHNPGARYWDSPDHLRHEEWFGIMSMGDGSDWLSRDKRKVYDYFEDVWNKTELSF
jgi:beta-glucuronidase